MNWREYVDAFLGRGSYDPIGRDQEIARLRAEGGGLMATYETRERTERYFEVLVPIPAVAADLGKAAAAMRQELEARGMRVDTDDCYWVDHDDDHIILRADVIEDAP